jgi:hypothetical protein
MENYWKNTLSSEQQFLNCAPAEERTDGWSSLGEELNPNSVACLFRLVCFDLFISHLQKISLP